MIVNSASDCTPLTAFETRTVSFHGAVAVALPELVTAQTKSNGCPGCAVAGARTFFTTRSGNGGSVIAMGTEAKLFAFVASTISFEESAASVIQKLPV